MAAVAIACTINGRAMSFGAGPENTTVSVMACAAKPIMEVGYQVTAGVMACFTGAVTCCPHLARVVIGLGMGQVGHGRMAGDAGVGVAKASVLIGVADGEAPQGDRGYGAGVATDAAIVNLGIVGIDFKGCTVAVSNASCAASTDEQAVVRDMVDCPICVAVDTGEGDGIGRTCLGDGIGDRAIERVDGSAGAIGPG